MTRNKQLFIITSNRGQSKLNNNKNTLRTVHIIIISPIADVLLTAAQRFNNNRQSLNDRAFRADIPNINAKWAEHRTQGAQRRVNGLIFAFELRARTQRPDRFVERFTARTLQTHACACAHD